MMETSQSKPFWYLCSTLELSETIDKKIDESVNNNIIALNKTQWCDKASSYTIQAMIPL